MMCHETKMLYKMESFCIIFGFCPQNDPPQVYITYRDFFKEEKIKVV